MRYLGRGSILSVANNNGFLKKASNNVWELFERVHKKTMRLARMCNQKKINQQQQDQKQQQKR